MGGEKHDGAAIFEIKKAGKGRLQCYKLYAFSVLGWLFLIWAYRATHIPEAKERGGWRRWAWIGLFGAELWFDFYWVLTQAMRWNPTHRFTFNDGRSPTGMDEGEGSCLHGRGLYILD